MANDIKVKCKICNDNKKIFRNGVLHYCECYLKEYLEIVYKYFKIYERWSIKNVPDYNNNYVINPKKTPIERVNYFLMKMLYPTITTMSHQVIYAYDLVEIQFDNDIQGRRSYKDINDDILIIIYGYNDFRNNALDDLVQQVLAYRHNADKLTWIVAFKNIEGGVLQQHVNTHFTFIDVIDNPGKTSKIIDTIKKKNKKRLY